MLGLVKFSLLLGLLLVLQIAVLHNWLPSGWPVPNLALLLIIFLSVHNEESEIFGQSISTSLLGGYALLAGLGLDFLSLAPIGFYTLMTLILGLACRFVSRHWVESGFNYKSFSLLILMAGLVLPIAISIAQGRFVGLGYILWSTLLAAVVLLAFKKTIHVRT